MRNQFLLPALAVVAIGLVSVASAAPLTGDQVYAVSNIFNAGVADGFVRSFAGYRPADASIAFSQQRDVWPGGPTAAGTHGASVTIDHLPLPTFASVGVVSPGNFEIAKSNSDKLDALLISRTDYAPYFSLGSLIASAEAQAQFSDDLISAGEPKNKSQAAWNLSLHLLIQARDLAATLCSKSKTTFNVTELTALMNDHPTGPTDRQFIDTNSNNWGDSPGITLNRRIKVIRDHLGAVISSPATLESGVAGQGC